MSPHVRRGGSEPSSAIFPDGPEIAPDPHGPPTKIASSSNAAGVANLAPTPTTTPESTAVVAPSTSVNIAIPKPTKIIVPTVVLFAAFLISCVVGYRVYIYRRRRAKARAGLPQIVVHSYSQTDTDAIPPFKKAELISDDDSSGPTNPSRGGGLPSSQRDGTKKQVPLGAGPIAIKFPTSGNGDEKDSIAMPMPAVRLRPPKPGSNASRLSVRTSSLIAARVSEVPRLPSLVFSPASPETAARGEPKLAIVIATFTTTLPDELSVKMGETLRVLEEFADGWCSVERVNRSGAKQTGVVPLCCIQDKSSMFALRRLSLMAFGK